MAASDDTTLPAASLPAAHLRFAGFELRPRDRLLLDARGEAVPIGGRAFDVLVALAQRPGQLVTKQQLLDLAWPGLVVEEGNLTVQVSNLRKVLGTDVIGTVPGRGYRFLARPQAVGGATALDGAAAGAAHAPAPLVAATEGTPPTPLIGRDDELAALDALLDDPGTRLVTIVGPGGVGKTLLARHVLARHAQRHVHGAGMIELAALADAADVPPAVVRALGLAPGDAATSAALAGALAPLQLLLVLDNAEHLLGGVAELAAALLAGAPRLRLLVTSQAPLRLADEQVLRLGPLGLPAEGDTGAVVAPAGAGTGGAAARAERHGAVALFVRRARQADARFALDDAQAAAAVALCRALDGLPLAIELAAARLRLLGLSGLQQALQRERLQLLGAAGRRDALERQQTLRATLAWSVGLLGDAEQRLFDRLAVVVDSASLELVQALGCDDGRGADPWATLDALDVLVERSLVAVVDDAPGGATRYRLLESPRAFASERLAASGALALAQRRHAQALADALEAIEAERWTDGTMAVAALHERARLDIGNTRAALAWARGAGEPLLALRLAVLLMGLVRNSHSADIVQVAEVVAQLDATAADAPPRLRARAALAMAAALTDARPAWALAACTRGLALARALPAPGDARLLYSLLCELAAHQALHGPPDAEGRPLDSQPLLAEARALLQPQWSIELRTKLPNAACRIHIRHGRVAEAAIEARAARPADDDAALLDATLVDLQLASGDAAGAVQTGRRLVERLARTRNLRHLMYAKLNLAAAHLRLDQADDAEPLLRALWHHTPVIDHLVPYVADYLALLAAQRGRPADAAQLAGYADAAYAARGDQRQANEAEAVQRALAVATAALGADAARALHAEGAGQPALAVPLLAFGAAA